MGMQDAIRCIVPISERHCSDTVDIVPIILKVIHPFIDENDRTGRLLVNLTMLEKDMLSVFYFYMFFLINALDS
jgi:hypothetical protein